MTPESVKQSIAEGRLEEALQSLVNLLESNPNAGELVQAARVNQADLYQLKAQMIKGTVSNDEARLINNQVADNALLILGRFQQGKTTLTDPVPVHEHKNAWRYFAVGGSVTLIAAFVVWNVVVRKSNKAVCPSFGNNASLRVLILPMRQTGTLQNEEPELEIMDGLNKYIGKTPGLSAIADVNENYDIEDNYPNPEEAAAIARQCNAQMIVWGRFNQNAPNNYRLDVQYKLLDAAGVRAGGDTTINRLLTVTDEGEWTHDAAAVVRLLYAVIANQANVRIASEVLDELTKPDMKMSANAIDTTINLVLADAYIMKGEPEKAVVIFDQILNVYPGQKTALTKRGALLFEQKDFVGAARDLEAAAPDPKSIDPHLQEIRIEAYLKSGQTEKAGQDIETMQEKGVKDDVWINTKKEELLNVSTKLLQELKPLNELAASPKASDKTRIKAGRANLATGDNTKAIKNANNILDHNPKSSEAIALKVEALVAKGDTGLALDLLRQAQKAGVALQELELAPRTKAAVKSKLPEKQ